MAASEAAAVADFPIVHLAAQDADALSSLSIEAGWNQVAADWRLMLTLGQGFGVRDPEGGWLASALNFPLGPDVSWISMVLVTRSARKRGIGTRLLSRCIAQVDLDGAVAGLDATEFGRPVYLPLGFCDAFPLARWRAGPGVRRAMAPPEGIAIRAAAARDLLPITAYDRERSGFSRAPILAHLADRWPVVARVAVGADGRLAGYALGRDGYAAWHVGPVVADDEETGLALLSSAVAASDQAVIVDVPDTHGRIKDWLAGQGATAPRRFMRMLRGTHPQAGDATHVVALAGPELA